MPTPEDDPHDDPQPENAAVLEPASEPTPTAVPGKARPASGTAQLRRRKPLGRVLVVVGILVVSLALVAGVVAVAVRPGQSVAPKAGPSATTIPTSLPANASPPPVLAAANPAAPVPTATGLAQNLAGPLASPALGSLGATVIDPSTGTALFGAGSTAVLKPGSALKLYTGLAAATSIPTGTRFATRVVAGAQPGQIVLIGGGDATLSSQPTSTLYPGAASVQQLADQVAASGFGAVSSVVVDVGLFVGAMTAPGWGSGDAPSTYAAPVESLMVDGGRTSPADKALRSATPAADAGRLLLAALGASTAAVSVGTAPTGATQLAVVQSAPIEDLVEQAISTSDNTLADVLARQVAIISGQPASFEGAAAAVTGVLTGIGVDLTGFAAYDGSGISGLNTTTAQSVASVLSVAVAGKVPGSDLLISALAVGGYNGTLQARFRGTDSASAAGQVRAKTGTLTGVDALAGVVLTADGRLLVFAFLSNGNAGPDATRAALDALAATLAACGCR